jgi:chromosome segregation ATPase
MSFPEQPDMELAAVESQLVVLPTTDSALDQAYETTIYNPAEGSEMDHLDNVDKMPAELPEDETRLNQDKYTRSKVNSVLQNPDLPEACQMMILQREEGHRGTIAQWLRTEKEKAATAQSNLNRLEGKTAEVESQLNQQKLKNQDLNDSLYAKEYYIKSLENKLSSASNEARSLNDIISQNDNSIKELTRDLKKTKLDKDKMAKKCSDELGRRSRANEELKLEIADLKKKLHVFDQRQARIQALEIENQAVSKQLENARASLILRDREYTKLDTENQSLGKELRASKERLEFWLQTRDLDTRETIKKASRREKELVDQREAAFAEARRQWSEREEDFGREKSELSNQLTWYKESYASAESNVAKLEAIIHATAEEIEQIMREDDEAEQNAIDAGLLLTEEELVRRTRQLGGQDEERVDDYDDLYSA